MDEMRRIINKKAGHEVAHSLSEDNPTQVKEWIPTGSRWLDSIICKGNLAGIPVGKIVEIAGLIIVSKHHNKNNLIKERIGSPSKMASEVTSNPPVSSLQS